MRRFASQSGRLASVYVEVSKKSRPTVETLGRLAAVIGQMDQAR
jgi:hypothetical protein